jgi:hypothetical protein
MDKKKLTLSEIKVKSFVNFIDEKEQKEAKGGYVSAGKNKGLVTVRWTALDNRTNFHVDEEGR